MEIEIILGVGLFICLAFVFAKGFFEIYSNKKEEKESIKQTIELYLENEKKVLKNLSKNNFSANVFVDLKYYSTDSENNVKALRFFVDDEKKQFAIASHLGTGEVQYLDFNDIADVSINEKFLKLRSGESLNIVNTKDNYHAIMGYSLGPTNKIHVLDITIHMKDDDDSIFKITLWGESKFIEEKRKFAIAVKNHINKAIEQKLN